MFAPFSCATYGAAKMNDPDSNERELPLSLKAMSKQEFGRHLQRLLNDRNWSQADLTRQVLAVTGKRMGRDAISTYINGHSFPTPASLNRLCRAFGLSRDELIPTALVIPTQGQHLAFGMRVSSSEPGKAWVEVNRSMSFDTATEIARLLSLDDSQNSK